MDAFDYIAARVEVVAADAQRMLDLDLMVGNFKIDEVAVLCETPDMLDRFVNMAVLRGADNFNSVEHDVMKRQGRTFRRGRFDVKFEFLRFPGKDYRIEAMTVLKGSAPLHSQHRERFGAPSVVHASFKCSDPFGYADVIERLHAVGPALPFCAEYSNSYGVFSYWNVGKYFLKPRVNIRDAIPS